MTVYPSLTAANNRVFAAYPVALQAILVDERDRVLLLHSPTRNHAGAWQTVSGGLEAGETILAGTRREIGEELGPAVRVRPVGAAHVQTFQYDAHIPFMIGIYYVFAYLGGEIVPGDDMAGSTWRWFALAELAKVTVYIPPDGAWLMERAVALTRQWRQGWDAHPLQPPL